MEEKKVTEPKVVDANNLGNIVSKLVSQSDYLSAACVLDNAPKDVNTQALYALLAVACSVNYDEKQNGSPRQERPPVEYSERTTNLVDGLINYFKSKSGNYFQND